MRTVRFIVFVLLFIGFGNTTKACQCTISTWDFFDGLALIVKSHQPPLSQIHVVEGILLKMVDGYGVQVKILHNFYGDSLSDTVMVWGDPGWLCRLNLSQYYHVPGDTIIGLLEPLWGGKQTMYESDSDFSMNPCMFMSVQIYGDSVYGGHSTSFTFNGYPLSLFLDSMNHALNTLSVPAPANNIRNPRLVLYPNPGQDFVNIELQSGEVKSASLSVTNISGQLIYRRDKMLLNSTPYALNISGWSSGTYFLTIKKSDGMTMTSLFLKQ